MSLLRASSLSNRTVPPQCSPANLALAVLLFLLASAAGGVAPGSFGRGIVQLSGFSGDARGHVAAAERGQVLGQLQRQPIAAGGNAPQKERAKAAMALPAFVAAFCAATICGSYATIDSAPAAASGHLTAWSPTGPPHRNSC